VGRAAGRQFQRLRPSMRHVVDSATSSGGGGLSSATAVRIPMSGALHAIRSRAGGRASVASCRWMWARFGQRSTLLLLPINENPQAFAYGAYKLPDSVRLEPDVSEAMI